MVNGSLGLKYLLARGRGKFPLSFAATFRAALSSEPSYAGYTQFPGVSLGGVLEARFGPFGLLAAPEIQFSPFPIGNTLISWEDRDFHAWAAGRFGLFFDSGNLVAGFSTAFAGKSFQEKPGLHYPVHTAFEVHRLLPDSLFYLSGFASWEHYPSNSDRIFLGGGLGIIY